MLCRNAAARRAAGLRGLKCLAARNPAADVVDHFPERRTHRNLHQTGVVDLAAERENLRARGFFGTNAAEPIRAFEQNLWHISKGFNVIKHRRLAKETAHR